MQDEPNAISTALSLVLLLGSGLAWATIGRRLARREAPIPFEPRGGLPFSGVEVVLLLLFYLLGEIVAQAALERWTAYEPGTVSRELLFAQAAARAGWLVVASAYLFTKTGGRADTFGWDFRQLGRDAGLGIAVFFAAAVPVFAVQVFFVFGLGIKSEHPAIKLTQDEPSLAMLAAISVVVVGVAPLFEEFVFRVLLQGWLEAWQTTLRSFGDADDSAPRPGYAPLVVVSLLFGALHGGHGPDPVAIFVLSLFLGYAYRQTHRIVPSLVAHACLNGWTMVNLWIAMWSESV
ncbi:MAG: CPBP family intramembrane metalloprotease [Planctomycetota bacterium]|nr:MAG: CPBP family intramembrane metalloprotease [Planctomycetota bacterium]